MSWLALLWILIVVTSMSWVLANILVAGFSPLIRQISFAGIRRHLWAMAVMPWSVPLLAVITLLILALAKHQGWIHDHCETHLPHHPHFCFEHLPEMAVQLSNSMYGLCVVLFTVLLLIRRWTPLFILRAKSHSFQRLVSHRYLVKTLEDERPLAFTLGESRPSIFISRGLRKLLSKKELRIVVSHEVAHARHMDVAKNTLFEVFLSLHAFPSLLRSAWYLSSEVRADQYVAKKFDALEVADVLIKLGRSAINPPFPTSIMGGQLSERIRVLIHADRTCRAPITLWFLYLILLAFPFVLLVGHHSLETLWGWLL